MNIFLRKKFCIIALCMIAIIIGLVVLFVQTKRSRKFNFGFGNNVEDFFNFDSTASNLNAYNYNGNSLENVKGSDKEKDEESNGSEENNEGNDANIIFVHILGEVHNSGIVKLHERRQNCKCYRTSWWSYRKSRFNKGEFSIYSK